MEPKEKDFRPKPITVGTVSKERPSLVIQRASDLNPGENVKLRLLLYGRSGTGKTFLLGTLPRPLGVIDIAGGSLTLAGEHGILLAQIRVRNEEGALQPQAWELVAEAMRAFARDDRVQSIALDDVTALSELIMTYVLWLNNHVGSSPTQPEYQRQMDVLRQTIMMLFGSRKHVAVTAHEDFEREEGTGRGWVTPLVTGKLKFQLPGLFDEVWHTSVENIEGKSRYVVTTMADRLYTAKSRLARLGVLRPVEDVTVTEPWKGIPPDAGVSMILARVEKWQEMRASEGGDESGPSQSKSADAD